MTPRATSVHAERALRAHAALRERFERPGGRLRRDGRWPASAMTAHVWPFARALVADLDVLGMGRAGAGPEDVVQRRTRALDAYWDERGPAYASDPPGGLSGRLGGDIYYDDNAWVGLALLQLERLRPGHAPRERIAALVEFAGHGWDPDPTAPHPGGIFWLQQERGPGSHNHNRNAISTAPNGQVMLGWAALENPPAGTGTAPDPADLADWVSDTLTGPSGLIRDKIRGDGTIDAATWSYNQGAMIGLRVALAERGRPAAVDDLAIAEALADRALEHYAAIGYRGEPDAFVAIFLRNLLILHARTQDGERRARILTTLRERADAAWRRWDAPGGARRATLLELSALVSLSALAAWDPADYGRIV